jgi:hypothetical protein
MNEFKPLLVFILLVVVFLFLGSLGLIDRKGP